MITSQFYVAGARQYAINAIQQDDPSYDPVAQALKKTPFINEKLFAAACDRVYFDGIYGPVSAEDWEEQDGRKPYTVREAINIIARVLANVEDYVDIMYCGEPYFINHDEEYGIECKGHEYGRVLAEEIRAEIVYWYREIYGVGYPHV